MDTSEKQLFVKMVMDAWNSSLKRTDALINSLTDESLGKQVSAGRNSGTYLLGHLAAIHDRMISLLRLGEPLRPEFFEWYVATPEKKNNHEISVSELKNYWMEVNAKLNAYFIQMPPEDWFQKHNSISATDFEKEPHRNRLNVMISRTNHMEYHRGQLAFLKNE